MSATGGGIPEPDGALHERIQPGNRVDRLKGKRSAHPFRTSVLHGGGGCITHESNSGAGPNQRGAVRLGLNRQTKPNNFF